MATKAMSTEKKPKEQAFSTINGKAFLTVTVILLAILLLSGILSYFVPQGTYERDATGAILMDTYVESGVLGIPFWRVLTAPIRVFATSDAITILAISIFLLIMSGVFNLLEKTGGIKAFIVQIMNRLQNRNGSVICVTVLVFMLFGSLFGMFEELVALLPLILVFMLSMNMDTMMGLGTCLLAACFGFSAAITNPFSVGIASRYAGIHASSGMWLRILFFVIIYVCLCCFLLLYLRKIQRNPKASLTYAQDCKRRETLTTESFDAPENRKRAFRVYSVFFVIEGILLVAIASIRALSGLAIPILAASFLIFGLGAGFLVSRKPGQVLRWFLQGAVAMLPAVVMIAIASSVKLVMEESGIMDTIMHWVLHLLEGSNKFVAILLIYFLILFLQLFIGSATAKIVLLMPIVVPIARALGISPTLIILTYCMADGFTDVIMPTNPVLLIGLSMANISYTKWVKWTWKLQLLIFAITVLILLFGVAIGY